MNLLASLDLSEWILTDVLGFLGGVGGYLQELADEYVDGDEACCLWSESTAYHDICRSGEVKKRLRTRSPTPIFNSPSMGPKRPSSTQTPTN